MANTARKAAIGLMAIMAVGAGRSATASSLPITVIVRVENLAAARPIEIEQAEKLAAEVYAKIGVSLVWLGPAEETPDASTSALELRVALLSDDQTERLLKQQTISSTVLGVAPPDTDAVYVFCHRVERKAAAAGRTFASILGRVLAHEIGHQLLPRQRHSPNGIMRAHMDMRAQVVEGFTREQGHSIRTRLIAKG